MTAVKLTRAEWIALALALIADLGRDVVEGVILAAIGEERGRVLIDKQEGPALSKQDNRRIIQELYKVAPGTKLDDKLTWAISIGQRAFPDAARFAQITAYVYARVSPADLADPPPVVDDPIVESDAFLWEPGPDSVRVRIPRSLPHWRFGLGTLATHHDLYGPNRSRSHEYILPGSGAAWAAKASAECPKRHPSIMVYINTFAMQETGHRSAGWRIMDPTQRYEGDDGTRLLKGQNK
jgi:hypothetical protein